MIGNDMTYPSGQEGVWILQELDLGCHTLFLMSDGSIDLLANDEYTPYLAENALRLDSDETYRLFISLHEQLKQKHVGREDYTGISLTAMSDQEKEVFFYNVGSGFARLIAESREDTDPEQEP